MPYISERLAQADMWKTATSWSSRVMLRGRGDFRATRLCQEHRPAWTLHRVYGDRLIFGTVREPVEWLCSYYDHLVIHGRVDLLAGHVEFSAFVEASCTPAGHWPGLGVRIEGGRQPDGPLWEWMVRYFYQLPTSDEWAVDVLVDAAQARQGLAHLGLRSELGRKNETSRARVAKRPDLMTPALREMVYDACGGLAGELGYTEPFTPAAQPLLRVDRVSHASAPAPALEPVIGVRRHWR